MFQSESPGCRGTVVFLRVAQLATEVIYVIFCSPLPKLGDMDTPDNPVNCK